MTIRGAFTGRAGAGWCLAGMIVVLVAVTGKGLYVSPDSVFYVGTARNWLHGRGLTPPAGLPPLVHFPPLFTVVLASLGRLGFDPLDAARVVNIAAFAGVAVLVAMVVRSRTGSMPAATVAMVLTLVATDALTFSASALSEPIFVLLALSGLVVLAAYVERPVPSLLASAIALVGAACLTRYVGIAAIAAGLAALTWRRHWAAAAVFGALSLAPVAAWLLWASGRRPSDRTLDWHLFGAEYMGQAVRPLSRWLLPWPNPPAGLLLALALVVAGFLLTRRLPAPAGRTHILTWVLVAFAVAYLAVLFADRILADATGRLDARFLMPLHVVTILVAVPALHRRTRPRSAALVGGVVVLAQVAGALAWTVGGLTDDGTVRRGYTAAAWRNSPVMALIAENDDRLPVYSNAFDAIGFLTGEPSMPIPPKVDYLTGRANPAYRDQLKTMASALQRSGGYLAWFSAATYRRSFLPTAAELEHDLPLDVVIQDDVGTLYRVR